jgi:hypothetical protein
MLLMAHWFHSRGKTAHTGGFFVINTLNILRCNRQPDGGETVGVISLPGGGWASVPQASMWFKPGLDFAHSVLPLKKTDTHFSCA